MDLSPYLSALREDLATAASAGEENTRRAAATLAAALEPAARLALMNALSDFAAEVTAQLDTHVVDLRLAGRDVNVVVTATGGEPHPSSAGEPPPPPRGDGDISRITVRLIEELKTRAEQAAADQGVSLNAFISQAVNGALHSAKYGKGGGSWPGGPGGQHGPHGHGGSRVHGWVQG